MVIFGACATIFTSDGSVAATSGTPGIMAPPWYVAVPVTMAEFFRFPLMLPTCVTVIDAPGASLPMLNLVDGIDKSTLVNLIASRKVEPVLVIVKQ